MCEANTGAGEATRWQSLPHELLIKIFDEMTKTPYDKNSETYEVNPAILKARLVSKSLAKQLRFVVCIFCPDPKKFVKVVLDDYCRTLPSHPTYDKSKLTLFKVSHVYNRVYRAHSPKPCTDRKTRKKQYAAVIRLARLEKANLNEWDFKTLKIVLSNVFRVTYSNAHGQIRRSIAEMLSR